MPLIEDTTNILGYYDESWAQEEPDPREHRTFAMALGKAVDMWADSFHRWPVRNRQERTPISSLKRAIIHERDGGVCRLCGTDGHRLTVDHIIPRSAFPADKLHVADRSDNLISACWPCNEGKSNYERHQRKRLGVVYRCWDCEHPDHNQEQYDRYPEDDPRPPTYIKAFCGGCGITVVPSVEGWIL